MREVHSAEEGIKKAHIQQRLLQPHLFNIQKIKSYALVLKSTLF